MKNYYFSYIVIFILFSPNLIAQKAVYKEDFADTAKNWTIVSKGDGVLWKWLKFPTKTWPVYMTGNPGFTTYNNGYMAYDSDSAGIFNYTGNQNSEMTSKAFNCTGISSVYLKFQQQVIKYNTDTFRVAVSNDSIVWKDTLINRQMAVSEISPNPQTIIWNISSVALGKSKVYLRFQFRGDWEYWWCIDDIEVYEPCKTDNSTSSVIGVSCKGFNDGSINLTPDGTLPFKFRWSTGDTTEDVSGLIAGNYTITITDSTNCNSTKVITVNEPTIPVTISKIKTNVTCKGGNDGTAKVTVSGGTAPYIYKWSDNSTLNKIINLSLGNYFVTVTDSKGCFKTDSFQIKELQSNFVSISGDNIICVGGTGVLKASNGFASYLWLDGSVFDSLLVDTAKKYTLSAIGTDGCVSTDTFGVVFYTVPKVTLGNDTGICFRDSIILNAGNGFTSYLWSNSLTSSSIKVYEAKKYFVTITDSNSCKNSDTLKLNVNALPVFDIGNDTSICKGDTFVLKGKSGFMEYNWSNGSTTDNIFASNAGTHYLEVTDSNTCKNLDSIKLAFHPKSIISIGSDTLICPEDSISLDASAIFVSFLWNNGKISQSIFGKIGTYFVTVVDTNTCIYSDTIHISNYIAPVLNLGNDTGICFKDTITLASSGFEFYKWNDGSTSSKLNVFSESYYYLNITDSNTCKVTDTLHLAVYSLPVFDIGNDTSICKNDTIEFKVKSEFVEYDWSEGGTTFNISVAKTGTYYLQVTDSNTCKNIDSIKLTFHPESIFSIGTDTLICTEDSILLDAGDLFVSYLWYNGETTQNIFGKKGQYSVEIIDSNSCHGFDTIVISNYSIPVVNIGGDDTSFCKGNAIKIDAGSGFASYLWSTSETTQRISVSDAGLYSVKVIDVNTCINWDSILVIVNELPIFDLGPKVVMCELDTFDISADGFYVSYKWSTGETTSKITVSEPGKYTLNVVDDNGCEGSSTKQVLFIPAPESQLKELDTLSCPGDSVVLDAGEGFVYYLWNDGKNDQTRTIYFPDTGLFTVIMYDENFCGAQDSIYISHYIPEDRELTCFPGQHVPFEDFVTIYPNPPTSGQIAVAFNDLEEANISLIVYNYTGQIVFKDELKNYTGDYEKEVNLKNLSNGLYILQIYNNNSMIIRKIINP